MVQIQLKYAPSIAIIVVTEGGNVMNRVYLCIDLKTFFASVECSERHLDPFETNLVVADPTRGRGALCLAITPKMKSMGIHNRCRIFDIPKDVDYITAMPRMHLYMEYSVAIYHIYCRFVSPEDIHVYSIDECFIDITSYMHLYHKSAKEFAKMLMDEVKKETQITATCGIGTNLYLAKVALDIISKHTKENIGILDEKRYQKYLWHHLPITDFWHMGPGTANHLLKLGVVDMEGITRIPEEILYKEFGVNAEYMIDHAWGRESATIASIKQYRPKNESVNNSQVLFSDYNYEDALLVVKEMVELNVLRLVEQHLVTDCIHLYIGYSRTDGGGFDGGSRKLTVRTHSLKILMQEFVSLYHDRIQKGRLIRQISISFGNVMDDYYESYDLFSDREALSKEEKMQQAIVSIRHKYGKNAILKLMNKQEKATTEKRNTLIGGHNAA